jgi:hypothetical protein
VPTPTLKARDELLPLTVKRLAPGPEIVRLLLMGISPVVSVMAAGSGRLNMMVSPEAALFIASLNEPAPLSAVLVTVRVERALTRLVPTPEFNVPMAASIRPAVTAISLAITDFLISSPVFVEARSLQPLKRREDIPRSASRSPPTRVEILLFGAQMQVLVFGS